MDLTKLDQFCVDNGIEKWIETSAKDNVNVDQAFLHLVHRMWKDHERIGDRDVDPALNISAGDKDAMKCPC
jgi:hypothetical protein